jgi:lysophospholipid acyltransferase (LPLAT)-like uncharacterized protein
MDAPRPGASGENAATRCIAGAAAPLLRGLYRTWSVRAEGFDELDAWLAAGRRVILATWHGRLLTCLPHFGRRGDVHVMISQSRDGDRVAAVASRMGVIPVRGSSTRGGARALLTALRLLEKGQLVGHIVDGPRGPAGDIKPGLLHMASRAGAAIAPVYAASRAHWSAQRSWDHMEVPLPFSRVLFRFGGLRVVPPDADEPALEVMRHALEAEMREGYARADADVRGAP